MDNRAEVNVMLVDDGIVMREGLCALIEQQPDLVVVAQAATVGGAGSADVTPDVIVTDIELPDARHGAVISGLRGLFPHTSILVLTLVGQPAKVQSVLAAGANGYLLKTATTAELFSGIRALASGQSYLQPSLGVELAHQHRREITSGLSPPEREVLRLVAIGHTNADIAHLRGVSLRTIESHRARMRQKLGRLTRAELVQYACDIGLIEMVPT